MTRLISDVSRLMVSAPLTSLDFGPRFRDFVARRTKIKPTNLLIVGFNNTYFLLKLAKHSFYLITDYLKKKKNQLNRPENHGNISRVLILFFVVANFRPLTTLISKQTINKFNISAKCCSQSIVVVCFQ